MPTRHGGGITRHEILQPLLWRGVSLSNRCGCGVPLRRHAAYLGEQPGHGSVAATATTTFGNTSATARVFHGISSWAKRARFQCRAPSQARGANFGVISAGAAATPGPFQAGGTAARQASAPRIPRGVRGVRGGRRRRRRGPARQRRRPGVRPERTGGRQGRAFCRARARPGLWPSSRRHRRRVRLLGGVAPERPRLARLRLDWLPRLGGEARPLERLAGRHGLARRLRRAGPPAAASRRISPGDVGFGVAARGRGGPSSAFAGSSSSPSIDGRFICL